MQQRLMEAKHDMSRIQNSKDLLETLKDVETERDVLVDFIQSDMKKSATVTEKLEESESKLRLEIQARVSCEKKFLKAEEDLKEREAQVTDLQEKLQSLHVKVEDDRQAKRSLEMELDEVKISLERKALEADELFKMQTSLLSQVRNEAITNQ